VENLRSQEAFFAALGAVPAAAQLLQALRWPDGVHCPHCDSPDIGGNGRYHRNPALPRYRCRACRRRFLLTTGTPLARSRVPLTHWVIVAWLIALGLSAWCAARETGEPYARVYAIMWRLIEAAIGQEADRALSGTVEADEVYASCGHKGQAADTPPTDAAVEALGERSGRDRGLRHGPGRGHADKDRPAIFVLVERGGPRVLEAGPSVDRETVVGVFTAHVVVGSQVYTDSARCYLPLLGVGYRLEQVNHTAGEYARGEVYENSAESEILLLWRFLSHHRGVSLMNLPSYLKLHQFERNHRERPHWEQAELLLASLLGNGPAPRCLLRPEWGHTMAECRVGRHVRQEAGEESLPLAA
jgi:transposase-like protein